MATKKTTNSKKRTYTKSNKRTKYKRTKKDYEIWQEIKSVIAVSIAIFFFVCNFGLIGTVGNVLSNVTFGLFGVLNYIAALFFAFLFILGEFFAGNSVCTRKIISLSGLFLMLDMIIDLINGITKSLTAFSFKEMYMYGYSTHRGGGIFSSVLNYWLLKALSTVGTVLVILVLTIIFIILLTENTLINKARESLASIKSRRLEDKQFKEELYEERRLKLDKKREEHAKDIKAERKKRIETEKSLKEEEKLSKEDKKVLKRNQKLTGITLDTDLGAAYKEPDKNASKGSDDIHEITLNGFDESTLSVDYSRIPNNCKVTEIIEDSFEDEDRRIQGFEPEPFKAPQIADSRPKAVKPADRDNAVTAVNYKPTGEYKFPPLNLLNKSDNKTKDSAALIKQTASKLQDTLAIFGVEATVTDISQGPTVTRFELQPKLGVKVSRIKSLSDDIKLNLAVSEIRIEAPIPGKAAIGIEVPNKEAQSVALRDIIDTPEFKNFNSKLAFAVGKDIAGKTIVYDIDSFPHVLIAGATGSGKSVCINTLIMSIIYKASPDEVKFIMIDPKVVELSVYNDIPHLLLPVVTKVDKAAATINYAVSEMHARFNKFEEFNVRDIAGYNRVIAEKGEDAFNEKMPHIIIIIDEMADLMLQKRKEVEDPICSLAQLARAAGIHLVIATQRPSVDVITGLIKANMPSRIAFAVASQVDSRTILDMGGAEELLGKGDMLFFPKGLKKPVRLQGGYVSDKEVIDVVKFLKQQGSPNYDPDIEAKIKDCEAKAFGSQGTGSGAALEDENDVLFTDAGFYIIDSNNASIGNLQRKFKIGFNRAARIVDQLADAGVLGSSEGTKARQILMSREDFENYLEEYGG